MAPGHAAASGAHRGRAGGLALASSLPTSAWQQADWLLFTHVWFFLKDPSLDQLQEGQLAE